MRFLISLALLCVCVDCARAEEDVFSDFEQIYLTVFEDIIHDHKATDGRVFAVALGEKRGGTLIPMPAELWKRLSARLKAKGVDLAKFVPADEVVWKEVDGDGRLIHESSGKDAWVYVVHQITWRGGQRLYVQEMVTSGFLSGGGSTLILEKKNGKWIIVKRIEGWVS